MDSHICPTESFFSSSGANCRPPSISEKRGIQMQQQREEGWGCCVIDGRDMVKCIRRKQKKGDNTCFDGRVFLKKP